MTVRIPPMDYSMNRRALVRAVWHTLTRPLPEGRSLPAEVWQSRHRTMLALLWLHAAGLIALAVARGVEPRPVIAGSTLIALTAVLGGLPGLGRKARTGVVAVGLMAGPALLVHVTEGVPEAHFHFFVMLAVITLYHDWFPFLVAFGSVLLHHTVLGVLVPEAVFSHEAALNEPLVYALLHAAFVLAASAVGIVAWRLNERERSRAEQILDSTGGGIYGRDREGRITFVNAAGVRLLGRPAEELVGQDDHQAFVHSALDGSPYPRPGCPVCAAVGATSGVPAREAQFGRADGTFFPVEYSSTPLVERGRATGAVIAFTDLTEQAALTRRALHDSLTGLPNRALFKERLQQALARLSRRRALVAVMFLDLDRFKLVNDSLGHAAGDDLLVAAARRLQGLLRTQDTVARLGGDEFVLLCEDVASEEHVLTIADRIVAAFGEPFHLGADEVGASVSIGITITAAADADPDGLLQDADAAMYRAKEGGRDRYELFDAQMRVRALERLRMESDLRQALSRGEFVLHYQPNVDLSSGRLIGVEALIRWQHPQRGLLLPSEFMGVAEETGQTREIGAWVLEEACRQARQWRARHPRHRRMVMSVNLSGRQLAQPDLVQRIASVLERTGTPPSLLCLEITEAVLMRDTDATSAILRDLKRLGVQLAVDDFGTGYSSLSYLTRFPVDTLKVDRSFVTELGDTVDSWSIVAAVLSLSQALGLSTVAEGVERDDQATVLRNLGCEHAQGFHFARPQPAGELEEFLAARAVAASSADRLVVEHRP